MEKKYRLDRNDTIEIDGHTLHRIIALKSSRLHYVEGDLGGYIESEDNLSHAGTCWISDKACVFGSSKVKNHAFVFGNAVVKDSIVNDTSRVYDASIEDSFLEGVCNITGRNVTIFDSSLTDTDVYDDVKIIESEIFNSIISDNVTLKRANITHCELGDSITINNTTLQGIDLKGNAVINSERDYIIFQNNFSSGRRFVWTRSNDKWNVGCFYGTGKELIEKAYKDNHIKGRYYEAYVNFIENIKEINDERTREFEQSTKDISLG